MCNYRYVYVPNDGNWGTNDTGEWTGMVGMAVNNEIDLALGQFTQTLFRAKVVEFSMPFFKSG